MGASQARDPRATTVGNNGGAIGGYLDNAALDLGNGIGATISVNATRNQSTVAGATVSTQLLAANAFNRRIGIHIINTDATKNLYIGLGAAATQGGPVVVAPGAVYFVPAVNLNQQINGIWDAGVTGGANIVETIA